MVPTRLALKIALAVLSIGLVAALCLPDPSPRLRFCGHSKGIWDRLSSIIGSSSHCCSSGSMINVLRQIEAAQALYYDEHKAFATSLDQLTNRIRVPLSFACDFTADKQHWSISVPRQQHLAGNYLFTSRGKLYFHPDRPATTNDLDLFVASRQ